MNKENETLARTLNMYGRIPETYELINDLEEYKEIEKYLIDELNKYKEVIDKIKEYIKEHTNNGMFELRADTGEIEYLLDLLEEIDE